MGTSAVEIGRVTPLVRRRAVVSEEPFIGSERYDYADAFEIRTHRPQRGSAEQFARTALEQAPWPVRLAIRIAHRYLLRFRLGPASSPDHVLGWRILTSEPDVVVLEADAPLLRAVIIARKVDPTFAVAATYVFFTRPGPARFIWKIIGPLHRIVAPYLLKNAAVRG
ncbi:MAG: hypothetical protein QOK47_69 [Actinomycetota bacterium]|nr:hypothetical protein [Actinomycetota bacterium]